jgi:hypothetical protein
LKPFILRRYSWQGKAQEVLPEMAKHLDRWRRDDFIRDVYKIRDLKRWMKNQGELDQYH